MNRAATVDLDVLCCPVDRGRLAVDKAGYRCVTCQAEFNHQDGMPDLAYSPLPALDGHVPYIWSDVFYLENLLGQRRGARYPIRSVRGDATTLPLADQSVDVYVGHHAINDIWLSRGELGVDRSYEEMDRVTRPDGFIVHSDCVLQHDARVGDPSTKLATLGRPGRLPSQARLPVAAGKRRRAGLGAGFPGG